MVKIVNGLIIVKILHLSLKIVKLKITLILKLLMENVLLIVTVMEKDNVVMIKFVMILNIDPIQLNVMLKITNMKKLLMEHALVIVTVKEKEHVT